jgi:hypothetical protein
VSSVSAAGTTGVVPVAVLAGGGVGGLVGSALGPPPRLAGEAAGDVADGVRLDFRAGAAFESSESGFARFTGVAAFSSFGTVAAGGADGFVSKDRPVGLGRFNRLDAASCT